MDNLLYFTMCCFMSILLAYFISGSGGFFVLILLVLSFVISLLILILSRRVKMSLSLSTDVVGKGDSFAAYLDITKPFRFLPTCFMEVTLAVTPNIEAESGVMTYRLICSRLDGDRIEIPMKASLCTAGVVSVEQILLRDYLGIIRMKLKKLPEQCAIRILPDIPDTGSQTEVLRSVSERMSFDDSAEESDETSSALTGVPGYEHREYRPGDPLKRINWKLSSKKDQFMVRLDEKVTSSSQVFRLDLPADKVLDKSNYIVMDNIVEGSLAMLSMLVRAGYESEYNYCVGGKWEKADISDEGTLVQLQERLSGISPYGEAVREPDHNINEKGKAMLCFTSCTGNMTKELTELADSFEGTLVVSKLSGITAVRSDMWEISSDFEFSKLT
ncbi:DUF58 domain-containing protein [Ruminococcus sp.]|uniref:DUF58 domain-containing protein n=1 Tax=Ruminococcus sp. TaxID=41978 RepID=UPI0025DED520|nr:DUF58 domain-containing protein [Ruminococcus sp.]MBQ8966245.1 DUF58 domain-containing protein [Ruminococcus sp.]